MTQDNSEEHLHSRNQHHTSYSDEIHGNVRYVGTWKYWRYLVSLSGAYVNRLAANRWVEIWDNDDQRWISYKHDLSYNEEERSWLDSHLIENRRDEDELLAQAK